MRETMNPTSESWALTLSFVLLTSLICDLYASLFARGLYADAGPLLIVIYERRWFFLDVSGYRALVDLLRQTPIVLLSRYTAASLFQCGQVLTFVMLALPLGFLWLCWRIAPRGDKGWTLFPLIALLVGFAPTSMNAVGEATIATFYFWMLLFLLLFKTHSGLSQAAFVILCVPAFWLHEGAFLLTFMLLLALLLRVRTRPDPHQRLFLVLASTVLVTLFAYQIRGVLVPRFPGDRAHIVHGLTHFEFLCADHRFNLPMITGSLAFLSLAAVSFFRITSTKTAAMLGKAVVVAWILIAIGAIIVAMTIENSVAPLAQAQSRYHPVFVSTALSAIMIILCRYQLPNQIWNNSATVVILIFLCVAQATTDIEATRQWASYTSDLRSTLARHRGLIPWEARLNLADKNPAIDWQAFEIAWTIPYMCVIFASGGVVNAMIDLPKDLSFRPFDPEKLGDLPKLTGIDFSAYRRAAEAPNVFQ